MFHEKQVSYLYEVGIQGGIRRAADILGVNPSVISRQISQLERTLQLPLLERRGRTVILTEAGKLLAADYRRFLSPDDYATLAQLDAQPQHDGNTAAIQQLLYKLALLEYNDGSWRRSHPVVRELEGYRNAQQALAQP